NESDVVRPDRAAAILALACRVRLRVDSDDDALALLAAWHAAPLRDDLLLGESGRVGDAGLPRHRDRGAKVVPRLLHEDARALAQRREHRPAALRYQLGRQALERLEHAVEPLELHVEFHSGVPSARSPGTRSPSSEYCGSSSSSDASAAIRVSSFASIRSKTSSCSPVTLAPSRPNLAAQGHPSRGARPAGLDPCSPASAARS